MNVVDDVFDSSSNAMRSSSSTVAFKDVFTDNLPTAPRRIDSLSRSQWKQLGLLTLCFTLAMSSVTLVMSEAPLVVKVAGGSDSLAPISLAMFEIGKSFVVLFSAGAIIRYGRKKVFYIGSLLGLASTIFGILGVMNSNPYLILLWTSCAGAFTGIAYGYRFAAIETSPAKREFACTLCLSGGIMAAIVGPIGAEWGKHWFEQVYIGTYVLNIAFVGMNMIVIYFLEFPEDSGSDLLQDTTSTMTSRGSIDDRDITFDNDKDIESGKCEGKDATEVISLKVQDIIFDKAFFYASSISLMSWVCMNLPLSVVGIAMHQAEPALTHELQTVAFIAHFLGMFLPGLGTGRLIQIIGVYNVSFVAVATYLVAAVMNMFVASGGATIWIVGQFLVGAAWNLGFSAATIMISTVRISGFPENQKEHATKVQSYSEFVSFFGGGAVTISAGYIFDTDGDLSGWRFLNVIELLFVGIMLMVVAAARLHYGGVHKNLPSKATK